MSEHLARKISGLLRLITPLREAAVRVYLLGRAADKRGVRPDGIVEAEVAPDGDAGIGDRRIGVEVDLIVFHRAP